MDTWQGNCRTRCLDFFAALFEILGLKMLNSLGLGGTGGFFLLSVQELDYQTGDKSIELEKGS